MCQIGDIILINQYRDNDRELSRHSFVIIDDKGGNIQGFPYDFIANVLSSFKSESQRERKLSYPGNFEISHNDTMTDPDNGKDGYIKADQLYYFNKDKITYTVIGSMKKEVFNLLIKFIEDSDFGISEIIDNL